MTTFEQWLTALDPAQRDVLLSHRPDAAPWAHDDAELARVLSSATSVRQLAGALSLAQLQVLEALLGLGQQATVRSAIGLLARAGDDHDQQVITVLTQLYERGLAWPVDTASDGRVGLVTGVTALFPQPLGADGTAAELLAGVETSELRHMLAVHGREQSVDPRDRLEQGLLELLSDAGALRVLVTSAESAVCEPLLALAKGPALEAEPSDYADESGFDYDTGYLGRGWGRRPTRREIFQEHPMALEWALDRGIVLPARHRYGYSYDGRAEIRMPVEVSLALRGTAFRAPFTPVRPEPAVAVVDDSALHTACAVAVGDFAQQALAVLDMVARCPWPMTKSGGLGLRELDRLARAAVVTPRIARLVLELAMQAGLLDIGHKTVGTSEAFGAWRSSSPAQRCAALVAGWWQLPFPPTAATVGARTAYRPLERSALCDGPDRARETLIAALASLPPGHATEPTSLERFARWQRPLAYETEGDHARRPEDGWAVAWAEAETLGVVALGSLTAVGRALRADTTAADLAPLVDGLVPDDVEGVAVGSDLTAVAIGSPTDELRLLLDSMADRDASGVVVTWRFSPTSIRRALDDGADVATLRARLERVASTELPQTVRYLLDDVARRHGELRLSAHGTLVRGLEPSRVAEALVDRSLEALGLRRLAPTVLSSRCPLDETLSALRQAGYYPVQEGEPAEWVEIADLRSSA